MSEKRFKKIYIEISNICNLQCSFCPVVERDKKIMALETLRTTLRQAKPLAERICFHVMGEPLNHPDFAQCVELAKEEGVPLEITTNGTLLSEEMQQILLNEAIVQVNFSLQSFVDNFPQADPKSYFAKILNFTQKALRERPDLYINYRFWNLPARDVVGAVEKNEYFMQTIEREFSTSISRNVDPRFRKSKNITGRFYLHFDTRFEWPQKSGALRTTEGTCYGTRSQIAIHAEGTVVPCCLDKEADISFGDIYEQSIEKVLESPRYVKMRDGFLQNKLVEDLCQRCQFRERFTDLF